MVRTIKQWLAKLDLLQDEKGLTLVELLVALAIVGTTLIAFALALSTGSLAVRESDEEVTVQSLARTQLEYTKAYPYNSAATTYPTVNTTDNFSISVGVTAIPATDSNIQKVTANVSQNGLVLLTIEGYKVNR